MATPSSSFQQIKGFFHSLSRSNTEASQYVFESLYKSAHSIRNEDIWADEIPYAVDALAADDNVANNSTVLSKYTQAALTEVPGSNGQAWYLDDAGQFVRNWISPTDVPHVTTNAPSYGYEVKLYQSDGTLITPTEGTWVVDYYAGLVLFQEEYTPLDLGYGTPLLTCFVYIGQKGISVGGGDGNPGGASGSVQYNKSGVLAGESSFVYNDSLNKLSVGGDVQGRQLVSTVTGFPPLVVQSDSTVPLLNADLLDDYEATAFSRFAFYQLIIDGQQNVIATDPFDNLTLVAGANMLLTTDPNTKTITIAATSGLTADAAGTNTHVQFNDGGALGADVDLSYDKVGKLLSSRRFESTIPTGNSPFIVSSTTTVSNLSAEFVGGLSESDIASNTFSVINVDGTDIESLGPTDTFNIIGGNNVTLDVDLVSKSITINGSNTATAGGLDRQIQFNDSGTISGNADLTWDNAINLFRVVGNAHITGSISSDLISATTGISSANISATEMLSGYDVSSSTHINAGQSITGRTFHSFVNDGTSPFTVQSKTTVLNLSAEFLNGHKDYRRHGFETITVESETIGNITATGDDTLTLVAGTGMTLVRSGKSITFNSSASSPGVPSDGGVQFNIDGSFTASESFKYNTDTGTLSVPNINITGLSNSINVTASTLVTNLNADLLDGAHRSSFAEAAFNQITSGAETPISAESPTQSLEIVGGGGISVGLDDSTKTLTIAATGDTTASGDPGDIQINVGGIISSDSRLNFDTTTGSLSVSSLEVTSTTIINNLNAQYIDGLTSSDIAEDSFTTISVFDGSSTTQILAESKSETLGINAGDNIVFSADSVAKTLTIGASSSFDTVAVSGQSDVLASSSKSLNLIAGSGIIITTDDVANSVTVTANTTGVGTVTSVGLSLPDEFTITGSPVTTSGEISASWSSVASGLILASPVSSAGTPTFRPLETSDFPTSSTESMGVYAINTLGNAGFFELDESFFSSASKDGAVDTPSLRTLGTGSLQAASGDHQHQIATSSASGFLSSADKTKLDSISENAEPNENSFGSIDVTGEIVIDSGIPSDTVTFTAGQNFYFTHDSSSKELVFNSADGPIPDGIDGSVQFKNANAFEGDNYLIYDRVNFILSVENRLTARVLESRTTTGNIPLFITSTTMVPNLNVEFLGGKRADEFTDLAFSNISVSNVDISVPAQSDIISESSSDTLNLVGGNGIKITTNATTDTVTIESSTSTPAAGLDSQVQYNDNGSISADADFTYNKDTNALTVSGSLNSEVLNLSEATVAPMTVASNVVVNDLNADFLDGYHASEFASSIHVHDATDIVSGVIPIDRIPNIPDSKLSVIPIEKGGTGQTTRDSALSALLPDQSASTTYVLKTDGTSASWADIANISPPTPPRIRSINELRLTALSGNPRTGDDIIGATNIFLTPDVGDGITLYDSVDGLWYTYHTGEISISLSGLAANSNFDVFAYQSGGTVAIESLAWAGDRRATAVTRTNGVPVKSGDLTRRYVGTFRTTSSGTTEDSHERRYVIDEHDIEGLAHRDELSDGLHYGWQGPFVVLSSYAKSLSWRPSSLNLSVASESPVETDTLSFSGSSIVESAYHPINRTTYFADSEGSVIVYDIKNEVTITTITTTEKPSNIIYCPSNGNMYVGLEDGNVDVIDTSINSISSTITVGSYYITGMCYSPKNGMVYVASGDFSNYADTPIYKIDPASDTVVSNTTHVGGGFISGMSHCPTKDTIYINAMTSSSSGFVLEYDTSTDSVINTITI